MFISVSGYNYTGASAVQDLLKEYGETADVKPEIAFVYLPDGILDLDYNINQAATYFNGDAALHRFWNLCEKSAIPAAQRPAFLRLTKAYLSALTEESWRGCSSFDGTRLSGTAYAWWRARNFLASACYHFLRKSPPWTDRSMFLSYRVDNFSAITEQYLMDVIALFAEKGKIPVLNQFFSAYQPTLSMRYTPEARTIVVDRDPRDIYILGKIRHETHCYPSDDVKKFVTYFRRCWDRRDLSSTEQTLYLHFEDLVYYYEDTVSRIESFLNIHDHVTPKKCFDPAVSIQNTQLKERFPNLAEEIDYIERELSEYLYPFPYKLTVEKDFF